MSVSTTNCGVKHGIALGLRDLRTGKMLVRKVRGQDKVGKITLSASEVELIRKMGIPIEFYVTQQLVFIAKKRGWKWYFKQKEKA